jgi:hypothetical protein
MPTWKLSTANNGMSVEFSHWEKDNNLIYYKTVYRSMSFIINSLDVPDIDLDNNAGYDVFADEDYTWTDYTTDDQLDDIVSTSWDWNNLTDVATQSAIVNMWDQAELDNLTDSSEYDNQWTAMEDAGWDNIETSVWLYGPLLIQQISTVDIINEEDDPDLVLDMSDPDDVLEAERRAIEDAEIDAEIAAAAGQED